MKNTQGRLKWRNKMKTKEINTDYSPISDRAKRLFKEYVGRGFKVLKKSDKSGILFTNKECVLDPAEVFHQTFVFGFWLGEDEVQLAKGAE
jgi:hypothetical protein